MEIDKIKWEQNATLHPTRTMITDWYRVSPCWCSDCNNNKERINQNIPSFLEIAAPSKASQLSVRPNIKQLFKRTRKTISSIQF